MSGLTCLLHALCLRIPHPDKIPAFAQNHGAMRCLTQISSLQMPLLGEVGGGRKRIFYYDRLGISCCYEKRTRRHAQHRRRRHSGPGGDVTVEWVREREREMCVRENEIRFQKHETVEIEIERGLLQEVE